MHPLRAVRQPGPRRADAPPQGEVDLENASKLLKLIEAGKIKKNKELDPLPIVCDQFGRPKKQLTAAEEQELARRIQQYGDIEARNTLVLANMGLVYMLVKQQRNRDLRYEDLVQEGLLGLLRATETFDPERGIRFSTYCVYWIRARLQRLGQKQDRNEIPLIHGVARDAENPQGGPRASMISLQAPLEGEGQDREFGDTIAGNLDTPEERSLTEERKQAVHDALFDISEELNDQRLLVLIEQRLLSDNPQTLSVIGERLNLSREGARLLEGKLLRLAKSKLASHQ